MEPGAGYSMYGEGGGKNGKGWFRSWGTGTEHGWMQVQVGWRGGELYTEGGGVGVDFGLGFWFGWGWGGGCDGSAFQTKFSFSCN